MTMAQKDIEQPLGRWIRALALIWLCSGLYSFSFAQPQIDSNPRPRPDTLRSDVVSTLALRSERARARARLWADKHGMPVVCHQWDGTEMRLMDVQGNRPIYFSTLNHSAAIASGASLLSETLDFDLDGTGFTVGLWDQNMPFDTHQEFQLSGARVIPRELSKVSEHATNVAGTLGAVGVNLEAMGMAPGVSIDAYDWENDLSEMASVAASVPGEPGTLYVSNHSYGIASGWSYTNLSGSYGWHWMAEWDAEDSIEPAFGQYGARASILDGVAWDSPYYLAFIAAGNDRNDNPYSGASVYYPAYPGGDLIWQKKRLDAKCPRGDGRVKNGYDTLNGAASAKNTIAVGAVTQAASNGVRDFTHTEVSAYSAFGPTDDGRVKPDLVAQGNSMDTTASDGNRAYARVSGTSFSCPSASGSAILLVQFYDRLFPGQAMRASTLKGLLLHTADDLMRPGPDYQTGWGLMNVEAAAQLMRLHESHIPQGWILVEAKLDETVMMGEYHVTLEVPRNVTFTLCWTDRGSQPTALHDSRFPRLVHDLDLRVYRGDKTYLPFVLDPLAPEEVAVPGDNVVDNVEQIVLDTLEPGTYTIEVSRKRTLTSPEQWYSLISDVPLVPTPRHHSR
ncbi:MAG: S8 family serine peptidase [Planctomycetes bacterium]|nr:S8 family serine peptidase [Planctomycetota bacterium]